MKAAGTHGGFDVFTDSKGSASAIAISDDTALVSNSQAAVTAAIDRLAASSDRLSDSADYKDTLATLPSDNIVVGYAPGSTLQKLVALLAATRARSRARCGAAGAARPDLVEARRHPQPRLLGQRDRRGPAHPRHDAAQRQGHRPARAVHARPARPRARRIPGSRPRSATSTQSIKQAADQALGTNPDAQKQVSQVEALLGIKLDDLYALLSGDQAIYAGPGAPVSAGLILHPTDASKARRRRCAR